MMAILTSILFLDSLIIAAIIAFALYKYFISSFGYWKIKGVEYVTPKPFLGNFEDVFFLKSTIGHFLADLYKKVSTEFFGIWIFNTPHLVVRSPELIKHILVKDFDYFYDRTVTSDENADPVASKVLFILQNPEWKNVRDKLTPIFTSSKIKNMIPLMNAAADELKIYLDKHTLENKSLEAKEICAKFTTDVITSCAFGVNAESFKHENAAFRDIGRKMFDFKITNAVRGMSYFFAPTIVKLFKLTFFDPSVNEFCRDVFWKTIKLREKTGIKRNDLIDIIIEIKNSEKNDILFGGDMVVAQAMQFFAAGFETSSSTIAFALYEMCLAPNLQEKLRNDINKAMDEYGGLTYEALQNMKYLDLIIKETLRKYPVLPFLDRRCVKDYKIPNTDVIIEKGTPVYIPMFGLHYDPQYFPNPEVFDPERFNKQNMKTRPQYCYIPFGGGPHNCIGERFGLINTKLGIAKILSNFRVKKIYETPVPIEFGPKCFVLQSTVGLPMQFINDNNQMSKVT